jgi:hypothetical protein
MKLVFVKDFATQSIYTQAALIVFAIIFMYIIFTIAQKMRFGGVWMSLFIIMLSAITIVPYIFEVKSGDDAFPLNV